MTLLWLESMTLALIPFVGPWAVPFHLKTNWWWGRHTQIFYDIWHHVTWACFWSSCRESNCDPFNTKFAQKPFVTTQGKCQSHLHFYSKMTIKLQLELLIIICKPKIRLVNTQCKTQHTSTPHILKQFKPYNLENHSISSRKQAWKLERSSMAKWKPLSVPCPTYQCPKVPP